MLAPTPSLTLQDWESLATIAGTGLGLLALLYTGRQIKLGARVNRAQFWLELRKQFQEHRAMHQKLLKRTWSATDAEPDEADRAALLAYMGLFEHCEVLMQDNLLDFRTFYSIYGYRIRTILKNPIIVRDLLIVQRFGWERFVELLVRIRKQKKLDVRHRYVCGFRRPRNSRYILWWGYPDRQEGEVEFGDDWSALEAAYHTKLKELDELDLSVDFAWLRRGKETVHHLASKVPAPPALLSAAAAPVANVAGTSSTPVSASPGGPLTEPPVPQGAADGDERSEPGQTGLEPGPTLPENADRG
jgi:hypothetical protein